MHGENGNCTSILVRKPKRLRPLGNPRSKWDYNNETNLRKVGCEMWTGLKWLRTESNGGLL
jgi:hypothetical protein